MEKANDTRNTDRRKWILGLALALLLAGGLAYYFLRPAENAPLMSSQLLPEAGDASDQRMAERAQEIADASYFTMQINPEAVFEDGTSSGSIEIVNPGTNIYPIAVDVSLQETGEVIYSSGAIQPNQFVEDVKLNTPLTKGEYLAKATFNIYDPETKEHQGTTEAELTIIVKN